jgi:hypothetical protein
MAKLVYLKDPGSQEEGIVIDSDDMSEAELEKEYQPFKVETTARIEGNVDVMPTDRLLMEE